MFDFITFASGAVTGGTLGFLAFGIFNARRASSEREFHKQEIERKDREFNEFRAWAATISDNLFDEEALNDALEKEVKTLREAEAKRIAHLRSIASSGGKARAAQRKKIDDL